MMHDSFGMNKFNPLDHLGKNVHTLRYIDRRIWTSISEVEPLF